ncbi:hypothetical protein ACLOJK_024746 [Asimina triloba]
MFVVFVDAVSREDLEARRAKRAKDCRLAEALFSFDATHTITCNGCIRACKLAGRAAAVAAAMTTSLMAVSFDHHQRHGFMPLVRSHICKLGSFARLDSSADLDRITPAPTTTASSSTTNLLEAASSSARFHRSYSTPCLSSKAAEDDSAAGPRIESVMGHCAPGIRSLLVEAAVALASGAEPVPTPNGLGGAYYIRSRAGDNVAVVKPIDIPLSMNNPKGIAGWMLGQSGMRHPLRVSKTCVREVAAFLLDHGGFSGVPPTTLIKISHVAFHNATSSKPSAKIASIQRFVAYDFDAGDLGPCTFSVSSVHRIGILDVRLLNIDRHAGNILVKKRGEDGGFNSYTNDGTGVAELVPIDHGLCLPESLEDPYFEWLHWPQASVPFSDRELDYISRLDPLNDAELLRRELPSLTEPCLRILVLCTVFLKCAAPAGLSLADVGEMMTREFRGEKEEPSMLETLCMKAMKASAAAEEEEKNAPTVQDEEDKQNDIAAAAAAVQDQVAMKRPPMRYASMRDPLSPLHEEDLGGGARKKMASVMKKSVSFADVQQRAHDCGNLSFRDMGRDEWGVFLERFEELLPKSFESWKSMGLKLALGTLCSSSSKF